MPEVELQKWIEDVDLQRRGLRQQMNWQELRITALEEGLKQLIAWLETNQLEVPADIKAGFEKYRKSEHDITN